MDDSTLDSFVVPATLTASAVRAKTEKAREVGPPTAELIAVCLAAGGTRLMLGRGVLAEATRSRWDSLDWRVLFVDGPVEAPITLYLNNEPGPFLVYDPYESSRLQVWAGTPAQLLLRAAECLWAIEAEVLLSGKPPVLGVGRGRP